VEDTYIDVYHLVGINDRSILNDERRLLGMMPYAKGSGALLYHGNIHVPKLNSERNIKRETCHTLAILLRGQFNVYHLARYQYSTYPA